ncbi:protein of unknown function [Streptococcus thermophilus]|nr:protein of unknown function [Streptococcus thermophilus]
MKIIISSKINASIKGLANVLTHLKAYLINILQLYLSCLHIIIDSIDITFKLQKKHIDYYFVTFIEYKIFDFYSLQM